jgi:hypothetical protein
MVLQSQKTVVAVAVQRQLPIPIDVADCIYKHCSNFLRNCLDLVNKDLQQYQLYDPVGLVDCQCCQNFHLSHDHMF